MSSIVLPKNIEYGIDGLRVPTFECNTKLIKNNIEINKKNILNCLISASGNVLLGGEPVEMKDLSRRVKEEIRANDKLIISVKAHEKAEYDVYVEVLDQLKIANATRISIAETE